MYKKEALEKQKKEEKERLKALELARKKQAAENDAAAAVKEQEKLTQTTQATPENSWTNEQQKEMEKGMKEVSSELPTKERWIKIAEGVNGKSAKECFQRYKELCKASK